MPATPPPLPHVPDSATAVQPIVDAELDHLLRRGVDWRVGFAPFLAVIAAIVVWIDPSTWRRVWVCAAAGIALGGAWLTARWVKRHGLTPQVVTRNFLAMAALQAAMILGTGGLDSPLLPVMIPLAIVSSMLLGRPRAVAAVVGIQVSCLLLFFFGQTSGVFPDLELQPFRRGAPGTPAELGSVAAVIAGAVAMGATLGTVIRATFQHMVREALDARQLQLRTVVGQARELESLSGEIAHELKNPLASIKGLAALLERDVPDGRAAERLTVMRGEIDRMQSIIDEFLTFSRPLSPLTLDAVDPAELCAHVADLHEADALMREVEIHVRADAPVLRGDRRKLAQVLVNLVQNALEVAPPRSQVGLGARAEGEAVVFEVADGGPGVPEGLGDRVFQPGVSGHAQGSGLGLTIALALARQHGGDLRLLDRDGGGTVAQLRLPVGGPP